MPRFRSASTTGGAGLTTVVNNGAILLGNVQVPLGTFTLSTLASGGGISQAAGTSIFEYATATLTTQGGAINLSNAGNNFGGLYVDATNSGASVPGANISVREAGTNHYIYVNSGQTGNFTAVDDTANIIQNLRGGHGDHCRRDDERFRRFRVYPAEQSPQLLWRSERQGHRGDHNAWCRQCGD